jgi:hypothetical protein
VLFEASTTSGSNVPEGNERVVCSGLFYIFLQEEKNERVCFVLKTNKRFVNFFFLFFVLNFVFFFSFLFFFFVKSCKYTRAKHYESAIWTKCLKRKKKKKLQNKCHCNMLLCVIFTTFRKKSYSRYPKIYSHWKKISKRCEISHTTMCWNFQHANFDSFLFFFCKTLNLNVLKLYKTSCTILRFLQI